MLLTGRQYLLLVSTVAVLLCLLPDASRAGDPFSFSSNWNYRESGGDGGQSSLFNESYSLNYSKELSSAMDFSGAVRYSENTPSVGSSSYSLSPSLSLDVRNDLFSVNLSASEVESGKDGGPTRTSDVWGFNLSSNIQDWPSLRFYFNQSTSTDDSNPKKIDSDSTSVGFNTEYSFWNFDLLYDMRASQSEDNIKRSESELLDQTAQVAYSQSFWDGRIAVAASQQLQMTENTSDTRVGVGGFFEEPLGVNQRFYVEDNDLLNSPLVAASFAGVNILGGSEDKNLAIELIPIALNGQTVDSFNRLKVWLYRDVSGTQGPLLSTESDLIDDVGDWLVYYKDFSDLQWTAIALPGGNPQVTEDDLNGNQRTVVTLTLPAAFSADLVKVVATQRSIVREIFVDDVFAYTSGISTADVISTSRDSKNLQSQFSVSVRLTEKWTVSYSLRRAENLLDTGDSLQFNQSLSSQYQFSEKLGFAASISESTDESDTSPDRESRSYSLSMSALPLPTLTASLGYTHSENTSDDGEESISDTLSSSFNASIYPDLTAGVSLNWSQSENVTEGTESSNYGVSLNSTAYFTPRLDLNTNINYSESDSSTGETSRSTGYGLNLGYRPSDMLLLNFSYDGQVEEGSSSFSANSSWLWSKKLQSQFGLSYDFGDETSQQYNAVLSWLISRSLSLQSSGSIQEQEEESSWSINTSVNMIF